MYIEIQSHDEVLQSLIERNKYGSWKMRTVSVNHPKIFFTNRSDPASLFLSVKHVLYFVSKQMALNDQLL